MNDALLKCQDAIERLEDENIAMREAIREAINTLDRMRPSSLVLAYDDYVAAHGVSQEYAMSQEAITKAITKLKPFIKP